MGLPKINLTATSEEQKKSSNKKLLGKFFIYSTIIFIIIGIFFSYHLIFPGQTKETSDEQVKTNIWTQLKHLVASDDKNLKGEKNGRINILLLGIGGGNHEGSELTDTIIIASINTKEHELALLSIPRDLYVPIVGYNTWRKINTANALGEFDKGGKGPLVAKATVEKIFDIPVHYYIKVDFNGFAKIIDNFGGIDVYVENTLDDYEYPIKGMENAEPYESRFERLHIDKGWQRMDGELSLKYVRSRHAIGLEGSDFARARRQQNVISALKGKVFSLSTILNPIKINSLYNALRDNISTNLEIWEIIKLANLVKDADTDNIKSQVLDDSPQNLLYATTTIDGAFILKPKTNDWSELRYLAQNIFTAQVDSLAGKAAKTKRSLTLEIQNGTKKEGFAYKTSLRLDGLGYKTLKIGNATNQDHQKTIIYDLTEGREPESLRQLKEELKANIALTLPGWLTTSLSNASGDLVDKDTVLTYKEQLVSQADFLIILGSNTIPIVFNNVSGEAMTNNILNITTIPTTN